MTENLTIGFIGGGNLARAMAEGILKKGVVNSSQVIVSAPSEPTLEYWRTLSVHTTHSNADVINKADIIILACKPYQLECALKDVSPNLTNPLKSKLYVSVLAGISSEVLCSTFQCFIQKPFNGRIIRVMPNILALIGESCSAIAAHSSATVEDITVVKKIFGTLGKCEVVPEKLLSAVTGLSGSGPAYKHENASDGGVKQGLPRSLATTFAAECLIFNGGVKQGLPRSLATTFAAQTVLGAAKMVLETGKHPSQLKDEVCSAGGTTIHAVHALEKGGLRATVMNAVEAATKRADEISKE